MPSKCVSADSSFYICFSDDLRKRSHLETFVRNYVFHLGGRILSELPVELRNDNRFVSNLRIIQCDYYELIKPFFGRKNEHLDDGEYEAIGVGNYLDDLGLLAYLIIDDLRARTFVLRHFPSLGSRMVGTLGFLRDSCCRDQIISPLDALAVIDEIKKSIEIDSRARPCGVDIQKYQEILRPIMDEINRKAGFLT